MPTAFDRRVKRLREHVLAHEVKAEASEDFIEDYNDITKDEIISKLEERGIDHNPKDKKEVLYSLLVGE